MKHPLPDMDESAPRSIYDRDETADEDLWFLPPTDEDEPPLPIPRRAVRSLADPAEWLAAEARLAADLARAAADLARLDAVVEGSGEGMVTRLALIEAEAMILAEGGRVRREQIGRDMMGRGGVPGLAADLGRARWALRRLSARPGAPEGLRGFLGLHETEAPAALPESARTRPAGPEFDAAEAEFRAGMDEMAGAHPLTRAAYAFRLWQLAGLSAPGSVAEPAVAAARIAAQENRLLGFAPMAAARAVWTSGGEADERLSRWLGATGNGAMSALMSVRRVDDWAKATSAVVSGWKGGTPLRMVEALRARPLLDTEDAAVLAGISRDSAERLLARMQSHGMIRELTGQGRFRLWSAAA